MGDAQANELVRRALEKCVGKSERNQEQDGSWNISGGWAPILGTSMASRSLDVARAKGAPVRAEAIAMVDAYTKKAQASGGREAAAGGTPHPKRPPVVGAAPPPKRTPTKAPPTPT